MPFMLDVAIGLIFVYLVLSLLCSAISEALEHYLRYRAQYLRDGIQKLLLANADLCAQLYAHPLIKSLYIPSWFEGKGRSPGPSYIPSRQFVLALLDLVANPQQAAAGAPAAGAAAPGVPAAAPAAAPPPSPVAQLRAAINANAALPPSLKQALGTLINDAGDDMEKVKANVQQWFDGSMDRVSGWYKRRAQLVLLIIGAFVSVLVNVDTLSIIDTLSNDAAVRTAVVNAADAYVRRNQPQSGTAPASQTGAGNQATAPANQPAAGSQTAAGNQTPPPSSTPPAKDAAAGAQPVSPGAAAGTPPGTAAGTAAGTSAGTSTETTPKTTPTPGTPTNAEAQLANEVRTSIETVTGQLRTLGLPVGWRLADTTKGGVDENKLATPPPGQAEPPPMTDEERRYRIENRIWPTGWAQWGDQLGTHLFGWFLTAFALSFGAPFWFDMLNKIMVIRSTVKPREKSGEEGSEDRPVRAASQTVRIEVANAKS